ncbi:MAG: hypothetical protein Q9219_000565 [cf. Caloplaca sp. 3 TL-2023]
MAPQPHNPQAAEADDLFDYNVDMQDVFRDVDIAMDVPEQQPAALSKAKDSSLGLGIDEEIKFTRKRQPIPKLDEDRSDPYSDLASLLNVYQFWLDDLYPRAKFADGLAIIEKLGHSKKIQTMRHEWIHERRLRETSGVMNAPHESTRATRTDEKLGRTSDAAGDAEITKDPNTRHSSLPHNDTISSNDALSQEQVRAPYSPLQSTGTGFGSEANHDDGIPEDDLDILLAESNTKDPTRPSVVPAASRRHENSQSSKEEDFEAEMEVMAEMDVNAY